jgi:hypothetical protein
MSWFANIASSNAAISCLGVLLSALSPSWLSCKIWCFSPYVDSMNVRVFVKNLYIMFASVIGLWLDSFEGSHFYIIIWLSLFSMILEIFFVCSSGRKIEKIICKSFRAYFLGLY